MMMSLCGIVKEMKAKVISSFIPSQPDCTDSQQHTNLIHLTNEVPNYHENCFPSPVKSTDGIVKNFFFPVRYAQGEYVGVKKILKNLSNLLKFAKVNFGLSGT